MRAVYHPRYGGPEVLEIKEFSDPTVKVGEVLIRVYSSTVNRTDCAMLTAKPWIMRLFMGLTAPRKPHLGTVFAGIVEEQGDAVSRFNVGDRVFAFDDSGCESYAELLTRDASAPMALIPESVSFDQAAASIEGAHYAINFINKLALKEGDHVMVNGASGAIGSAAVQLLRAKNIKVTAVCDNRAVAAVTRMGAERVIDYELEDFTSLDSQFDAVFDAVGKSSFSRCKRLLKPGGAYVSSEPGFMGQNIFLALVTPLLGGKRVKFPIPLRHQESLDRVSVLMQAGQFEPMIDRHYLLEKTADAFTYVLTGKKMGNVLLTVTSEQLMSVK